MGVRLDPLRSDTPRRGCGAICYSLVESWTMSQASRFLRVFDAMLRSGKIFNTKILKIMAALLSLTVAANGPARAQTPKQIKTRQGVSIGLINLVSPKKDCSIAPGPVILPTVRQAPKGGIIQLQVIVVDVGSADNCPARKVPAIAVIYTPGKEFSGVDDVQVDITVNGRVTTMSYRITVGPTSQSL